MQTPPLDRRRAPRQGARRRRSPARSTTGRCSSATLGRRRAARAVRALLLDARRRTARRSGKACVDGTIDMLSSDHAPHTREEKEVGWTKMWSAHTGTPGMQYQLPLLLEAAARASSRFERAVELTASRPARGLRPRPRARARSRPGCDADLVDRRPRRAVDDHQRGDLSRCGWTPYDGRECRVAGRAHDPARHRHLRRRQGRRRARARPLATASTRARRSASMAMKFGLLLPHFGELRRPRQAARRLQAGRGATASTRCGCATT